MSGTFITADQHTEAVFKLRDRIAELEQQLAEAQADAEFYKSRVDKFQQYQSGMRDPERTLVCDILANNAVLPDVTGDRYGMILDKAAIDAARGEE